MNGMTLTRMEINLRPRNMRRMILLVLLCCSTAAFAQNGLVMPSLTPEEDSVAFCRMRARMDSIRKHRPTVAVVLAGGGARGMAHLGVLRYLEEQGIPVDMIGGTSMGGLVSGMYSLGYGEHYIDSLVRAIDWTVMMSDRIPDNFQTYGVRRNQERFFVNLPFHYADPEVEAKIRRQREVSKVYERMKTRTADMSREAMNKIGLGLPDGFLFGFNIRNTLSAVTVGYQDSLDFDKLPIPYFCVATDMVSMKAKNWTSGSVVDAMRSTMSIPMYFRPVRTGGMILSDGGTRNNFPIDVAKAMGADIVIGSEMPEKRDISDLNSLVSLALQNITMMASDAASVNREQADVLLQHTLKGYNMLSFDEKSISDIIDQGYKQAEAHGEEIGKIARMVHAAPGELRHDKHATDIGTHSVMVKDIRIEGVTEKEQHVLLDPLILQKDGTYDRNDIDIIMSQLYGTRAFESVTYRMEGTEEPYTLVFDCQKGQTSELNAGIHVDNDEVVYASLHLGLGTRKLQGTRFVVESKIGNNATILTDLSYKPLIRIPTFGIATKTHYLNLMYIEDGEDVKIKSVNTRFDAYLEDARLVHGHFRLGISSEWEPYENYIDRYDYWKDYDFRSRWNSAFTNLCFDLTDDGYFPNKGLKLTLNTRYVFSGYSIYNEERDGGENTSHYEGKVKPYSTGVASASGAIPLGSGFALLPSLYFGWASTYSGMMDFVHNLCAGGTVAGRYLENQLPYFGYSISFHLLEDFATTAQLNLRYQFGHANYLTLQSGLLQSSRTFKELFKDPLDSYAFGLQFGRKTVVGPFLLGANWSKDTGFGLSLSLGMNF